MAKILKFLILRGENHEEMEKIEEKIFSCYNALYKNPALAKHILDEMKPSRKGITSKKTK